MIKIKRPYAPPALKRGGMEWETTPDGVLETLQTALGLTRDEAKELMPEIPKRNFKAAKDLMECIAFRHGGTAGVNELAKVMRDNLINILGLK